MDDIVCNQNKKLDKEELDYLYSLYKASLRGAAPKLSKEEVKKLVESDRLNDKEPALEDQEKERLSGIMVQALWSQVEISLKLDIGEEEWNKVEQSTKQFLIWLQFVEKYGMDPQYIKRFMGKLISK